MRNHNRKFIKVKIETSYSEPPLHFLVSIAVTLLQRHHLNPICIRLRSLTASYKPVEVGHQAKDGLAVLGPAHQLILDVPEGLEHVEGQERRPTNDVGEHDRDEHAHNLEDEQDWINQ